MNARQLNEAALAVRRDRGIRPGQEPRTDRRDVGRRLSEPLLERRDQIRRKRGALHGAFALDLMEAEAVGDLEPAHRLDGKRRVPPDES